MRQSQRPVHLFCLKILLAFALWLSSSVRCFGQPVSAAPQGPPPAASGGFPQGTSGTVIVGSQITHLFTTPLPDLSRSGPSLAVAERLRAAADKAEAQKSSACVDLYYQAAVVAYACLRDGSPESMEPARRLYNRSLGDCLTAAMVRGLLRPSAQLTVATALGTLDVPIEYSGFVWSPGDFSTVHDPAQIPVHPEKKRSHLRAGLGATRVVSARSSEGNRASFLPKRPTFACTAVLVPDVEAWFSSPPLRQPQDRLIFFDPRRVISVAARDRTFPLAADFDAPLALSRYYMGGKNFRFEGLLQPETRLEDAGLFAIEPYQPGKVPVIFVHGLASSPLTWCDLIADLQSDPSFLERFQIWVFGYPTGVAFSRSAGILRDELNRLGPTFDPESRDVALSKIVLVGHSMGGLVSRLQTVSTGDALWNTISRVPLEQLRLSPESQNLIRHNVFFEPNPRVQRVVFVATPHRGSKIANELGGRITSSLIRRPEDSASLLDEIRRSNPEALQPGFRRLPTSVDLLEVDHPALLALWNLSRPPGVSYHSIVGIARTQAFSGVPGDGVVPAPSARLPGVDSELFVKETHGTIHHSLETLAELRRILDLHLGGVSLESGTAGDPGQDPQTISASLPEFPSQSGLRFRRVVPAGQPNAP